MPSISNAANNSDGLHIATGQAQLKCQEVVKRVEESYRFKPSDNSNIHRKGPKKHQAGDEVEAQQQQMTGDIHGLSEVCGVSALNSNSKSRSFAANGPPSGRLRLDRPWIDPGYSQRTPRNCAVTHLMDDNTYMLQRWASESMSDSPWNPVGEVQLSTRHEGSTYVVPMSDAEAGSTDPCRDSVGDDVEDDTTTAAVYLENVLPDLASWI